MGVLCYAKVLIFTLVFLLVYFTNLAKADSLQLADKVNNYDSYEYYPGYLNPDYPGYPDSKSMYIRWVSVVEFHDQALSIGKVFGQESTVVKWN